MKKKIDLELTMAEKQELRQKKVSQKALQDLAGDEIAKLLNASAERTRELLALAEFQKIPSLGIGFAKELIDQGYYTLEQLQGKSPADLLDSYEKHCGCWADPCVEDSYRLLVHYIEFRDDSKRWWDFTQERKASRAKFGYPADRPEVAWYETDKYPKAKAHMKH